MHLPSKYSSYTPCSRSTSLDRCALSNVVGTYRTSNAVTYQRTTFPLSSSLSTTPSAFRRRSESVSSYNPNYARLGQVSSARRYLNERKTLDSHSEVGTHRRSRNGTSSCSVVLGSSGRSSALTSTSNIPCLSRTHRAVSHDKYPADTACSDSLRSTTVADDSEKQYQQSIAELRRKLDEALNSKHSRSADETDKKSLYDRVNYRHSQFGSKNECGKRNTGKMLAYSEETADVESSSYNSSNYSRSNGHTAGESRLLYDIYQRKPSTVLKPRHSYSTAVYDRKPRGEESEDKTIDSGKHRPITYESVETMNGSDIRSDRSKGRIAREGNNTTDLQYSKSMGSNQNLEHKTTALAADREYKTQVSATQPVREEKKYTTVKQNDCITNGYTYHSEGGNFDSKKISLQNGNKCFNGNLHARNEETTANAAPSSAALRPFSTDKSMSDSEDTERSSNGNNGSDCSGRIRGGRTEPASTTLLKSGLRKLSDEDSLVFDDNTSTAVLHQIHDEQSVKPKDIGGPGLTTSCHQQSDNAAKLSSSNLTGQHGLTGLRNIGNTCFMNSVLQCMSNTRMLHHYILGEEYITDINTTTSCMKGALINAFAQLIRELWSDNNETSCRALTTLPLKAEIQRFAPRFIGYQQQDAQEFLRYLLEGLHEDVNRVIERPKVSPNTDEDHLSDSEKALQCWRRFITVDNSKFVDIFVGQLKSTLKCVCCGHESVTFDPFWDLSLPIPSHSGTVRLQACFDLFTREETLDGDEKPTCTQCGVRQTCTKRLAIQQFPPALVVHLKRFNPADRYVGKLSNIVQMPLCGLDLSHCSSGSGPCRYNLYGVANHSGTLYSGHYTACCRNPYSGQWHSFNDSRVQPVSVCSVISSEAYVLFFQLAN